MHGDLVSFNSQIYSQDALLSLFNLNIARGICFLRFYEK